MDRGWISDELKELFLSFSLDFPYDIDENVFLYGILHKKLPQFESEIKDLSHGVLITKDNPKIRTVKSEAMRVYEIKIGNDVDELIEKKDYLVREFFESKEENVEKIMLVVSESVGIIDAKLRVYRKYKDDIDSGGIFLLHAYENYDEIAKSIAFKKVSSFHNYVRDLINNFPTESLESVVSKAIDTSFTLEHITILCSEVHIEYKGEDIGTVDSGRHNCYSTATIQAIKYIIAEEALVKTAKSLGSRICKGVLKHIENAIQSELSHELRTTIDISDEIYAYIEERFRIIIIGFLRNIPEWIIRLIENIINFFVGFFRPVNVNSERWRGRVANEIFYEMIRKKQAITDHLLEQIKTMCLKTIQDLNIIDRKLKELTTNVFPKDKKQLIMEWSRRDVIHDQTALEKHPSIIQYIAGHSGNGKPVVKVFLRDNHDKDAQLSFKNACRDLENTELEFVNLANKLKEIRKQAEKIKRYEQKAPAIDKMTRNTLKQIIQEHGETIYATYSVVVGMRIGKVICVGDEIEDNPCIVLYCLDKNLIPFGEKPLPKSIAGWPCDIREDYVMFGRCPYRCPASRQNLPEPGCSIGIPSVDSSGSVGFLVEAMNPTEQFRCGFLTASHVAVRRFQMLYHYKSLLSMSPLSLEEHRVVHPSWQDNGHMDNAVGQVVESFCGNYGLCPTGLDFALVKSNECRDKGTKEKEALPIANDNDLNFEGETKVTKSGRTTGTTVGDLKDDSLTVKVESFLSRGYIAFFNCYAVEHMLGMNDFFKQGDSGSGVFVIENGQTLKPLGIAFAFLSSQTAVCKIDTIIDKLNLRIVRYDDSKQKQAENISSERNQEPMECA